MKDFKNYLKFAGVYLLLVIGSMFFKSSDEIETLKSQGTVSKEYSNFVSNWLISNYGGFPLTILYHLIISLVCFYFGKYLINEWKEPSLKDKNQ